MIIFNYKKYKYLLNYISTFFIIAFLFLWDINFPGTQYNIKFLSIFLVPFYFFKLSGANINKILLFFFFIFLHKLYFDNLNNSNFILFEYIKIIILLLMVLFFVNSYKFFFQNLENIILVFSLLTLLYYIYFITFNVIENKFVISCYNGFISQNNFLFKENSHFGFSFIGIFFYSIYQIFYKKNSNIKKTIYLIICIFIFTNYSTSFLITCIVISFLLIIYFLKIKKNIIPFSAIFFLSVFTILIDKQCNDRFVSTIYSVKSLTLDKFLKIESQEKKVLKFDIKSTESSYSLSSVIYINSFLVLKKIVSEFPAGVGFNNLNYYFADKVEVTKKNFGEQYWRYLEKFNHNDGTNNFIKLFAEFGFLFFILFYFLIKFILNKNISLEIKLFVIAPLINQLFFRGAGYFNGGFAFYLIIIIFLNFKNIKFD